MKPSSPSSAGTELPLALLAFAFFLALVVQTAQLWRGTETLAQINRDQETPLQEAAKLRQAMDSLASDLLKLSTNGDAGAQQVIDEMKQQNVVLHPGAADTDSGK